MIPIRIKFTYKNYPHSKKATFLSRLLGVMTSTAVLLVITFIISSLIFAALPEEVLGIAVIVFTIVATVLIKKFLRPFLDKKIDAYAAAQAGAMYTNQTPGLNNTTSDNSIPDFSVNNNVQNSSQNYNIPADNSIPDFSANINQPVFNNQNTSYNQPNTNSTSNTSQEVIFDDNPVFFDK